MRIDVNMSPRLSASCCSSRTACCTHLVLEPPLFWTFIETCQLHVLTSADIRTHKHQNSHLRDLLLMVAKLKVPRAVPNTCIPAPVLFWETNDYKPFLDFIDTSGKFTEFEIMRPLSRWHLAIIHCQSRVAWGLYTTRAFTAAFLHSASALCTVYRPT